MASKRLVTLTGTGGCGKTRIALRLASELSQNFVDGVYWIGLAPLADGRLLSQTIAKNLNIPSDARRSSNEILVDALKDKQALIILDNCEHILDACKKMVALLLDGTRVNMLTTSRQALKAAGETLYILQPMSLPAIGNSLRDIAQFDAIQLFVERTKSVVPNFEINDSNAAAVVAICRGLDGIPLAIELASARSNILTIEQIAQRLDDHFMLLPRDSHLTSSQHRGLRAAVDWSYNLLKPEEQIFFRRLSVFHGGCSISAVEKVCSDDDIEPNELLDLLSSLVSQSLIVAQTLQRSEAQYILLEPIRQYAQEKLIASGEWSHLRDLHLQCYLQLAGEYNAVLRRGYQQGLLERLEGEYDNMRAALNWALESKQTDSGLRIAIALYSYWIIRDYTKEGLAWFGQLLAQSNEGISDLVRANALAYATFLAGFRGNRKAQAAYGQEAAQLAEALGDEAQSALAWAKAGEAYAHGLPGPLPTGGTAQTWALGAQAFEARTKGDFETELAVYEKIIALHREVDERYLLGPSLISAGSAALSSGNYGQARLMVDEGLALLYETGNPYWIAMTLNGSGDLARLEGSYSRAQNDYEESALLLQKIGAVRDLASTIYNLGYTALRQGDIERAYALFMESMDLHQAQNNRNGLIECLMGCAAVAVEDGQADFGARLLANAFALGGQRMAAMWPATKMEVDHTLALINTRLTPRELKEEQVAGRSLSLAQAVEVAQNFQFKTTAQKPLKNIDVLTPREYEVARLVAQAKSNQEIAEQLVLSKRTVEKHTSNIRFKLGFTNRAQIVRWAVENGLVNEQSA